MEKSLTLQEGWGFTTGSCATAATKAALIGLLTGSIPEMVKIITPKGVELIIQVEDPQITQDYASCAIKKFSGDDPDITNGTLIYGKVEKNPYNETIIEGGIGVGRVTLKGLEVEVGKPAINKTPRQTIAAEIKTVSEQYKYTGGITTTISVPDGERLAKKTYNPRLGIIGGISILGTSGIVEPMSAKALIDTIEVELKVVRAKGKKDVVISPGNYGKAYINEATDIEDINVIKASNYLGDAIDMAKKMEFNSVLLIGHIGKFIKVAGGVFNTHSNNCDSRMEILAAAAIRAGGDNQLLNRVLDAITTEDALDTLKEAGLLEKTMEAVIERFDFYIKHRFDSDNIGGIIYSNRHGFLGKTKNADKLLQLINS